MSDAGGPPPTDADIQELVRGALAGGLEDWLGTRRWFADKGRAIASVGLDSLNVDRLGNHVLALSIIRVDFVDGGHARYFLPIALVESTEQTNSIATVLTESGSQFLNDATETAWFGDWLLAAFSADRAPGASRWEFVSSKGGPALADAARGARAELMHAEQSNTSIRFDKALIVKLIRRLQPEPNPEEEVLRFLTAERFPRAPAFVGSGSWRDHDGTSYPVALAQAFVPNLGDGWSWILARIATDLPPEMDPEKFAAERLLGQRTAELHIALSRSQDSEFGQVPADPAQIASQIARSMAQLERVIALLREHEASLPTEIRTRLGAVIDGLQNSASWLEGFHAESGLPRIRVHGDYHLGQTLRTVDNDWVIIDFEGEPARPVSERRQRASALKDVAGMLRSFAYARGAAERDAQPAVLSDRVDRWEHGARQAFLEGYRQTLRQAGARLVPEADDAFDLALQAWELDKALYEIAYEARNRPGWLTLPIRALLPDIVRQAPDAEGGGPA